MKKSAEFERSSDFDIKNGKQESDFRCRLQGTPARLLSDPLGDVASENDHARVGKSQI